MIVSVREQRLGEIAEFTNGGAWNQTEYTSSGVPVVRVTNLQDESVDLTDCKFLPLTALAHYSKHTLRTDDLVIATVGSHPSQPGSVVGRPTVIQRHIAGALLNQNAVIIRSKTSEVDQRWLGWLGRSAKFREYVVSCARGSANQVRMAIGLLKEMPIEVPSLNVQCQTASILGAYDDLIEVNRRRIAVLEEMARRLFDEWFVNFRFPGHEAHKMVETAIEAIPKGWTIRPFTDVADVLSGGTPRKERSDFWGGDIPFFTPRDAPKTAWTLHTDGQITPAGLASCSSALYPEKTVFITARGTVGKVALAGTPMAMNQSCYALRGRGYPQVFLYHFTKSAVSRLQAMSGGAVFDTIIVDTFRKLPMVAPPENIVADFERIADPILGQVRLLAMAIDRLASSRDLLLPRLISGELSVAAAEREFEDAA